MLLHQDASRFAWLPGDPRQYDLVMTHEQLRKRHDYKLCYTVTRLALQSAGLVRLAPKRSAHRK